MVVEKGVATEVVQALSKYHGFSWEPRVERSWNASLEAVGTIWVFLLHLHSFVVAPAAVFAAGLLICHVLYSLTNAFYIFIEIFSCP